MLPPAIQHQFRKFEDAKAKILSRTERYVFIALYDDYLSTKRANGTQCQPTQHLPFASSHELHFLDDGAQVCKWHVCLVILPRLTLETCSQEMFDSSDRPKSLTCCKASQKLVEPAQQKPFEPHSFTSCNRSVSST